MSVTPTHRDVADFFRIAFSICRQDQQLVELSSVVAWADSVIETSKVADEWMIDLSMTTTRDSAVHFLSHVPPPATDHLGASILVAYIDRKWRARLISREDACHLLAYLRDDLPQEHEVAAIVPSATLDDELACISQGMPEQYQRVDNALSEFFALYQEYDHLVPCTL